MYLIPFANLYLFFGIMTQDSDPGENRFGPNPKLGGDTTTLVDHAIKDER